MTPPQGTAKRTANQTARSELHHAIRRFFSSGIAQYYRDHPNRMDDERGRKKISMMLQVMHETLNEIDRYEIVEKPIEIEMITITPDA